VTPARRGEAGTVGERKIWVDFLALARGKLGDLRIDSANVEAWQPYPGYYRDLIDYLGHSHQVGQNRARRQIVTASPRRRITTASRRMARNRP